MVFTVRLAEPSDEESLRAFRCQNPGERWTRDVERMVRRAIADAVAASDPDLNILVAEASEEAEELEFAGVVCTSTEVDLDLGVIERVHALAVTHDWRRRKIGTALKEEVLARGARSGVRAVVSEVHRNNRWMRRINANLETVEDVNPEDGDWRLTVADLPDLRQCH